jgi:hypothetical protein
VKYLLEEFQKKFIYLPAKLPSLGQYIEMCCVGEKLLILLWHTMTELFHISGCGHTNESKFL